MGKNENTTNKVVKNVETINKALEMLDAYLVKLPDVGDKAIVVLSMLHATMQEIATLTGKATEENIKVIEKYTDKVSAESLKVKERMQAYADNIKSTAKTTIDSQLTEQQKYEMMRKDRQEKAITDAIENEESLSMAMTEIHQKYQEKEEKLGKVNVNAFRKNNQDKIEELEKYKLAVYKQRDDAEQAFKVIESKHQKDTKEYIDAVEAKEKALADFAKKNKLVQEQIDSSSKSFLTAVSERQNAIAGKINGINTKVQGQIDNAKAILKDGFASITKVYDERVNVLRKEKTYKAAKNDERIAAKDKELEELFAKVNKNDKSKELEKLQAEKQQSTATKGKYDEQVDRYRSKYKLEKNKEDENEKSTIETPLDLTKEDSNSANEEEKGTKTLEQLLKDKLKLETDYRQKLVELDEEGKEKKAEEKELSDEEALERIEMLEEMSNIEGEIAKKKEEEISAANLEIFNSEQFVLDEKLRIEAEKKALQEQGIAEQAELDAKIQKEQEKKKKVERIQKKAEFVVGIAQAISDVAKGAANALSYGPFIGPILAAMVAASGAVQVGIMTQQLKYMEDGGLLNGKRHSQGGMRILGSNIEVEGGEYVVNRESTSKNLGLINYINSQRKELKPSDLHSYLGQPYSVPSFTPSTFSDQFERGGHIPSFEPNIDISNSELLAGIKDIKIEPRVSVTDINTVHDNMVKVDEWTGL